MRDTNISAPEQWAKDSIGFLRGLQEKLQTNNLYSDQDKQIILDSLHEVTLSLGRGEQLSDIAQHLTPIFIQAASANDSLTLYDLSLVGTSINDTLDPNLLSTQIIRSELLQGANLALCKAASVGALAATEALLRKGSNVNTADEFGSTPLMLACKNGQTKIVKLLLECGANILPINISFLYRAPTHITHALNIIIMHTALKLDYDSFYHLLRTINDTNEAREEFRSGSPIELNQAVIVLGETIFCIYDSNIEDLAEIIEHLEEGPLATTLIAMLPNSPEKDALLARYEEDVKINITALTRILERLNEEFRQTTHLTPQSLARAELAAIALNPIDFSLNIEVIAQAVAHLIVMVEEQEKASQPRPLDYDTPSSELTPMEWQQLNQIFNSIIP